LYWILSFFVSLDDQIARISRMKASIFFVIRARSGPRFCSRQIPLKNVTIKPCARLTQGGSHSATGEEWADDDNAATAAEAQSFKRACSCFGLGRYLYYLSGTWVDLDYRKRPKTIPTLADWATPEGWKRGLRPYTESASKPPERTTAGNNGNGDGHDSGKLANDNGASLVREIEQRNDQWASGCIADC
jgi:hypothetical protein